VKEGGRKFDIRLPGQVQTFTSEVKNSALQRRRIEEAEMKLLRLLAGYTLYDHKTNDYISRELRITGILDKLDEYRRNWLPHLQRMPQTESL